MNRRHILSALWLALLLPVICQAQPTTTNEYRIHLVARVNARPSPYLADWESKRETVMLTIVNQTGGEVSGRISAEVHQGGRVLASTNASAMPMLTIPQGSSTWFADDIMPTQAIRVDPKVQTTAMRSGMLPSGDYELCVNLVLAGTTQPAATESCVPFILTAYQPPTLVQPDDSTVVRLGLDRPTFRWTPITPVPAEPVRYQLRIYEVLPGTTPSQSLASRNPIIALGVDQMTLVLWPEELSAMLAPGSYLWTVGAEYADGTPVSPLSGSPQPGRFRVIDPVDFRLYDRNPSGNSSGEVTLSHGATDVTNGGIVFQAVPLNWPPVPPECHGVYSRDTSKEWSAWKQENPTTKSRTRSIDSVYVCNCGKHHGTFRKPIGSITEREEKNSNGGTTTRTIDSLFGKKVRETVKQGLRTTVTEYDENGNPIRSTMTEGGKKTATDYSNGQKTKETVTEGGTTTVTEYDENGMPTRSTVTQGGKTTVTYYSNNQKTKETTAEGNHRTLVEFDNQVKEKRRVEGTCDKEGNITRVEEKVNGATTDAWQKVNRKWQQWDSKNGRWVAKAGPPPQLGELNF